MSNPRIPRKTKSGKIRPKSKHSDLYTDENPKGTMEQRAKVMGKTGPAKVYRTYINSIKRKK